MHVIEATNVAVLFYQSVVSDPNLGKQTNMTSTVGTSEFTKTKNLMEPTFNNKNIGLY